MSGYVCAYVVKHGKILCVLIVRDLSIGEMILPNITEAMKQQAMCKEPGSQWRFILGQALFVYSLP